MMMVQTTNWTTVTEETSFPMTTLDYGGNSSSSSIISNSISSTLSTRLQPQGSELWQDIDQILKWFQQLGYVPLSSLGVVGNAVTLWVWSAETTFNSTVFMLKVLAVWDLVYCMANLVYYGAQLTVGVATFSAVHYLLSTIVLISQICSIYITLLSSFTRLLAIFRPAQFNLILSRPRLIALCLAIFLWSLLLSSLEASWYVCLLVRGRFQCQHIYRIVDFYRRNYLYDLFAFCIPSFLLLTSNVLTVWKFSRHRKNMAGGTSSREGQGDRTRRLSVTMVMISVTSLLSHPVAVSVRLGLNPGQNETVACDWKCYYTVVSFCGLLTTFNSSVNVVYYVLISSRFKELGAQRLGRLGRLCCRSK